MPSQLLQHLQCQLDQLRADAPVGAWCVAFSGGLDSSVLLHALQALAPAEPVRALHINHQLAAEADDWQQRAAGFARALKVDFVAEKVEVNTAGKGLEDAARRARYEVFERQLQPSEVLLMAHHADDQVETLLLRLMRGSGVAGLGAMRARRALGRGELLRPLLDLPRQRLAEYAESHGLDWIDDHSNADTRFDRNYLRAEVLPKLAARWPGYQARWQRSAEHCAAAGARLNRLAENLLNNSDRRAERVGESLALAAVIALDEVDQNLLLRHWLRAYDASLSRVQLREIRAQLLRGREDARAEVAVARGVLRRFNQRLYLLPELPQLQANTAPVQPGAVAITSKQPLALPLGHIEWQCVDEQGMRRDLFERAQVSIGFRRGGERCKPCGRAHSQSLKKLLQEYRLEPWLRDCIPLVYLDGELAAVGDLWVCSGFEARSGEVGVNCRWRLD